MDNKEVWKLCNVPLIVKLLLKLKFAAELVNEFGRIFSSLVKNFGVDTPIISLTSFSVSLVDVSVVSPLTPRAVIFSSAVVS